MMAFSAHVDAKGILQLIAAASPRNVMLMHGDREGMEFMSARITRCTNSRAARFAS
jgi:integrator complex subunit 11